MIEQEPVPQQELTDEAIAQIYHKVTGQHLREQDMRFAIPFARAILAAKEK